MKINWKLRLQNKVTLMTLLLTTVAFVYQILGILGVTPRVTEDQVTQLVTIAINLAAVLGIIVDPTTQGINDSDRAMNYDVPNDDSEGSDI